MLRALRIHVKHYIEWMIYLALQDTLRPNYSFLKTGLYFWAANSKNKFFNLLQMLVIFSVMIIVIKITYDVILCEYWNLAEEAHTNVWKSNLAQYQQLSLLWESHMERVEIITKIFFLTVPGTIWQEKL